MDNYIMHIEVKNCWERTSGTVLNLLSDLDCPSLQDRSKIAPLTLFHEVIHGESALEFPSFIKRCNHQLRSSHNDRFIELRPKTEAYRNSFYWKPFTNNVLI